MSANDSNSVKKSWDDWSDLEISNKITELKNNGDMNRHIKINGLWHSSLAYIPQGVKAVDIDGNKFNWIPCANYCNNPADMWPIIVANKIGLQPDPFKDGVWFSYDTDDLNIAESTKPLRAAAIVFLKMNGVKPND